MATPSNRQSKSSGNSINAKDQVVDVTSLNSNDQPKTSSKIDSPLITKSSNRSKASGSSMTPIGKNKVFENNSNSGIALGMIASGGLSQV